MILVLPSFLLLAKRWALFTWLFSPSKHQKDHRGTSSERRTSTIDPFESVPSVGSFGTSAQRQKEARAPCARWRLGCISPRAGGPNIEAIRSRYLHTRRVGWRKKYYRISSRSLVSPLYGG
uniref:Putative secreted protein n=1 Tax=Ixodes ricinus TaxID=34613 RepID=A0A6B0UNQ8_IXORI